jgi:predicted DNA-binding transcriptional regulator AlpA
VSRKPTSPVAFDGVAPALLSKEQVGRVLGGVSVATVERLDTSGRLGPQAIRLGKLVRWRAAEMAAWCDAGCPPRHEWNWPEK